MKCKHFINNFFLLLSLVFIQSASWTIVSEMILADEWAGIMCDERRMNVKEAETPSRHVYFEELCVPSISRH